MIDWRDLRMEFKDGVTVSGEIVFSHVDDKTGEVRHFAVERIEKWLLTQTKIPILTIPIDYHFAAFSITARGIEQHRLLRITAAKIKPNPVIFAYMPGVARDTEDEHLMIDGAHRYCRAAMLGMTHIRGYELQPEHWEPFLVSVPAWVNEQQAELLSNQHINPIDSHIA